MLVFKVNGKDNKRLKGFETALHGALVGDKSYMNNDTVLSRDSEDSFQLIVGDNNTHEICNINIAMSDIAYTLAPAGTHSVAFKYAKQILSKLPPATRESLPEDDIVAALEFSRDYILK